MKVKFLNLIAIVLLTTATKAQDIKIVNTFHIASPGGWDYIAVNGNNVYVSHGTQVNILNKTTGDSVSFIPNTNGVHGIAFAPSFNKGFTSNGRSNNVTVFDLKTNVVLAQIETGQNPDAIFYDEFSKMIITCNGRSKDLSIIDPATNKVMHTVALGGKPETAVSNNAGKIFVNIEDKNEIVEVDATSFEAGPHWPLSPGEAPTGLAIDTKTNRLFAGCGDNKWLVVLDAVTGAVIDKLPIGDGCDGVAFDPGTKTIYASNGEGTVTVIKEMPKDKFVVEATIPTKKSARTITVDPATHKIYLPAADIEPAVDGKRGKMIPGSFQVLVLAK
ncbi:MAG: YncE family protein [Ferruginibacter sp.]